MNCLIPRPPDAHPSQAPTGRALRYTTLGRKTHLIKRKIRQHLLSAENGIKLAINNRKVAGKCQNTRRLSNTLLNSTRIKEEISREIKKIFPIKWKWEHNFWKCAGCGRSRGRNCAVLLVWTQQEQHNSGTYGSNSHFLTPSALSYGNSFLIPWPLTSQVSGVLGESLGLA